MIKHRYNQFLVCLLLMGCSYSSLAHEAQWLRRIVNSEPPLSLSEVRQQNDLYDCGLVQEDRFFALTVPRIINYRCSPK